MENKSDREDELLLLIEQARNCLLQVYREHSSFSHPIVYEQSMKLDKLLDTYFSRGESPS